MGRIPPTTNGYDFGEVASALQKSLRRGLEEDALYWAVELDLSGYGEYVWKRLRVVCSEDIGIAEPLLPAVIQSLYTTWAEIRKKTKGTSQTSERLMLVHAILLLSRAQKSRLVDHANIFFYRMTERREIPDWALDKHTGRGKRMGRGFDHFFTESTRMANVADIEDPYEERARSVAEMPKVMSKSRSRNAGLQSAALFDDDDEEDPLI